MILAVAFSVLVALFWLKKFRKMDKYEKEPERLVYTAFLAGVLATLPSILLELPLQAGRNGTPLPLDHIFLSFLWVGTVEEVFKYLAVRLTVYKSNEFNEVMDGMIYMISAALGFAATENVGYMLGFGFSVGFLRAILAYLGHVSFSAILGYFLGKSKLEGRRGFLFIGFGLAILFHWLYDGFLVLGALKDHGVFSLVGLSIWALGLILMFVLIKKAQAVSPFRTAHVLPKSLTRLCQACKKTVSTKNWICHHCGKSLPTEEDEVILKA